jgi:hypothetical protein
VLEDKKYSYLCWIICLSKDNCSNYGAWVILAGSKNEYRFLEKPQGIGHWAYRV